MTASHVIDIRILLQSITNQMCYVLGIFIVCDECEQEFPVQ